MDVAPPGSHTLVTADRHLCLVPSGAFPPSRPSADLLLTTLALACGTDAVAVVLTGEGHDGATGAAVVHARGGLVLVRDRDTSESFAMPSATIARTGVVDHVVPLDTLGARVAAHVRDRAATPDQP